MNPTTEATPVSLDELLDELDALLEGAQFATSDAEAALALRAINW